MRTFWAGLVAAGAMLLVLSGSAGAISRSADASTAEYPWVVQVRIDGRLVCGGSLATPWAVVTAAHCVRQGAGAGKLVAARRVVVVAGRDSSTAEDGGEILAVQKVQTHPAYRGRDRFNLAVLQLVTLANRDIIEIAEPTQRALWRPGAQGLALGWGADSADKAKEMRPAETLRSAVIRPFRHVCLSGLLCAGAASPAICKGDVGGPLVVLDDGRPVLAGIIHGTRIPLVGERPTPFDVTHPPCANPATGSQFTRAGVGALNAWLLARAPHALAIGGIAVGEYCLAHGYAAHHQPDPIQGPDAAAKWRCIKADGSQDPVDMRDVCRWMYPSKAAFPRVTDPDNAYTWVCYGYKRPPVG